MSKDKNQSPEERAQIAIRQAGVNAHLPPDALELLGDPRLDTVPEWPGGLTIKPEQPVRTDCAYLRLERGYESEPAGKASWVNQPARFIGFGGSGFERVTERPRIEDARRPPSQLFHLAEFSGFFVASPDVLEAIRRMDPEAIVALPIDWAFSDGQGLDGYVFLDVVRKYHLYDYRRSTVHLHVKHGVRHVSPGTDCALRDDIPAEFHIVRDGSMRHQTFMSRALAEQIYPLAHRELSFNDVQTRRRVEFSSERGQRNLLARLKPAEVVEENASMPLRRRMSLRIMPLLQKGAFAEAEAILEQWLAAEPVSPYHVIAKLQITNDPRDCAKYFDACYEKATGEEAPGAIYTEMNGFAINPDLWFCDAFAFGFHGGDDSFDWLGAFYSSTDEHYVIDGLEDLQRVFMEEKTSRPDWRQHDNARRLAEALVIVKFQRFMQSARAHMKQLNCPLLVSAHDYIEFVVEIPPAP